MDKAPPQRDVHRHRVAGDLAGQAQRRGQPSDPHLEPSAGLVAPALVAAAVFVEAGLYENTGETLVALLFMVIAGPYLSHATVRAIRVREKGDWRPGPEGRAPAGEKEQ